MAEFLPVGWDNGRVAVPAGATSVATMAALDSLLDDYEVGGANAGQAIDIHLTGGVGAYGSWGIDNYQGTGSNKLRIYGDFDGSTVVRDQDPQRTEAYGSIFRLKDCRNVEIYNIDFDAENVLGSNTDGSDSGMILGGSWEFDTNRGDCENIVIQGCRVKNTRQSGLKIDGDGGTNNVTIHLCTITNTGLNSTALLVGGNPNSYGEIIYIGDGNSKRVYSDITVSQNHLFTNQLGEAINVKSTGGTALSNRLDVGVILEHNLIHDVQIGNGGAIACENYCTIRGNRIYDYRVTADSDTGFPHGISLEAGGLVENNIIWTTETNSTCVRTDPEGFATTATCRYNTFFVNGGRAVYALNEFGSADQTTDSDHNAYSGTLTSGTNGGGGGFNDDTASFVGPTSGTADAGDGPGSGFELSGGAARNGAVGALLAPTDIQDYTRVDPTDSGAFDMDGAPPFTPPFALTTPTQGATAVSTTTDIFGTCSNGDTVSVRLEKVSDSSVIADWVDAVVTGQAWQYDPAPNLPVGTEVRARFRRVA